MIIDKKETSTWTLLENKKAMEQEGDSDTNYNLYTWNDLQRLGKGTGGVRNQRMSQDHPNSSIVEVS